MMLPFAMAGNIRTDYTLMPALTEPCYTGNVRQAFGRARNEGEGKAKRLSPPPPPFPFPGYKNRSLSVSGTSYSDPIVQLFV